MKNYAKLPSGFTFMFIDMLMVLLIFFICLTPTFTTEGYLQSNLPKDRGPTSDTHTKNIETITIYNDGRQIILGDNILKGKHRYKNLQVLLQKLTVQIYRFQQPKSIRILLDHEQQAPFESTVALMDTCHNLSLFKQGFIQIAFNYIPTKDE